MAIKARMTGKWKYVLLCVLAAVTVAVVGASLGRPTPVTPTAIPTITVPTKAEVPAMLVIGDSYSGGSDEGGLGVKGWPVLAQTKFTSDGSRLDVILEARGGSGYVHLGPKRQNFRDALIAPNPDLAAVLVFGSINDRSEPVDRVAGAARGLYSTIKKLSPKAKLIVVGPPSIDAESRESLLPIRDALAVEAKAAGAVFVDPIAEGWFTGPAQSYVGTDGVHPTDAGHEYMASKLAPVMKKVLAGASEG